MHYKMKDYGSDISRSVSKQSFTKRKVPSIYFNSTVKYPNRIVMKLIAVYTV